MGKEVCSLLKSVFDVWLMFIIDNLVFVVGDEYKIIFNGIELKINWDKGLIK